MLLQKNLNTILTTNATAGLGSRLLAINLVKLAERNYFRYTIAKYLQGLINRATRPSSSRNFLTAKQE
jgi:hypothetical protein